MPRLTIDGQAVEALAGETVLEAAARYGIVIPTLCHVAGLSAYGACRVCLVEVRKGERSRLEASCTLPATADLVIHTNSPRVRQVRKTIIELLVASCPTSKTLQDLASLYGVNRLRFAPRYENTCILCGRCVRYCAEQMQSGGIGFVGRGIDRRVGSAFEATPTECRNCNGCEWICPVCERACLADQLRDGLCGGCHNLEPVETCEICIGCSQAVGAGGHRTYGTH